MAEFRIEGNVCFMDCSPGTEAQIQYNGMYPDGRCTYVIIEVPSWIGEESANVSS